MTAQHDHERLEATPPQSVQPQRDYRRLWAVAVVSIGLVAVVPLLIMTGINYRQYQQAFREERTRPIERLTSSSARSLEFFLSERQAALHFVVDQFPQQVLLDEAELDRLLTSLERTFGGFVDLGVLDTQGVQIAYAGPYALQGQPYDDQEWYREVLERGAYTSEVFMGHRHRPHFVIAIRHDAADGDSYVLRASVHTETLDDQIVGVGVAPVSDAFVVDRNGVLQTPSRMYGAALGQVPWTIPPSSAAAITTEQVTADGERLLIGHEAIQHSPFVLVLVSRHAELEQGWLSLRRSLVVFLTVSVLIILTVVTWGVTAMVRQIHESDQRRAGLWHQVEYSNKMAAIGRLAAGVAHEVNNPLAIINEKAGLMKDLLTFGDKRPPADRLLVQVESIIGSVERCSAITHRLLGFAKHVDLHQQPIDLVRLVAEVYGFLERECQYRGVQVHIQGDPGLPKLVSDRGQLQQVFLNLLNNALAAVDDGGRIDVRIHSTGEGEIAICVEDDGSGIEERDMEHIFEPFFSTKGNAGTGLGLSITYGIVHKLAGRILVESEPGTGTTFTVMLPIGGATDGREGAPA